MLKLASSVLLCSATAVLANLLFIGPYNMELELIEECEEPEYKGGVILDIHLEQDNVSDLVYQGNITFNFDMDDPEMLTKNVFYKWGSTGGWCYHYTQDVYDCMEFTSKKFPKTFRDTYSSMGVYGKPMKAGTYPFRKYSMKDHQLENFLILPYGLYRMVTYFIKHGKPLGCIDFQIRIKEKASLSAEIRQAIDRSIRTINKTGSANGILSLPHRWQRVLHNAGDYFGGH